MNVSKHTWEDCPVDELFALAVEGAGNQHMTCIGFDPPESFKQFASDVIEIEDGYVVDHWVYWASNLEPVLGGDWQMKFPHTHQWDGRTLVLYLNEIEGGGELVVLEEDMVTERQRFPVKPGTAALMGDHAIHGVRAIHGSTNRVTMIAGAYPYPKGTTKCQCERQDFPVVTT